MRVLAVRQLWVQEGMRIGDFQLSKMRGEQHPLDVLTKHVLRDVFDRR